MTNSANPDQLASSEANWSGMTLFAKTGHDVFSKRMVNLPYNHMELFIVIEEDNKYTETNIQLSYLFVVVLTWF